jgi:hypothetical protein
MSGTVSDEVKSESAILSPFFRIARNPPTMKEMMKEVGAAYFIGFFAPETSAQSSITIPNVSPSKLAVEAADKVRLRAEEPEACSRPRDSRLTVVEQWDSRRVQRPLDGEQFSLRLTRVPCLVISPYAREG